MSKQTITLTSPSNVSISQTFTSPSNMSIPQTFTSKSGNKSRETSFSSYINGADETFVLDHICLRQRRSNDKEIDVFDAQKYYKEGVINDVSPKTPNKDLPNHPFKKAETLEIFSVKEPPRFTTPSIHSKSSSNSRSSFLHNFPRNHQPRKSNKKGFLAIISCGCSCADKKSIETDDSTLENGSKTNGHLVKKSLPEYNLVKFDTGEATKLNSHNPFSFPVFNSKNGSNQATKTNPPEVFGSPILETGKSSLTLDKKLTMLSNWDKITPTKNEELTIPSISSDLHNDSDTDSSSDLFEIESLSNCITPTMTCYTPSEISIEWSVATASAADFSAMSDSEELKSTAGEYRKTGLDKKSGPVKEMNKRRSNILSGCKSQKAVRVAEYAHRGCDKGVNNAKKLDKLEIFHSGNKEEGFDSRNVKQTFDATRLLYT